MLFPCARLAHAGPCWLWPSPIANAYIEIPSNQSGYRYADSYGDGQAGAHTHCYLDLQADGKTAYAHVHRHASDDTHRDSYATGTANSDAQGSGDHIYFTDDEFIWIGEHLMQALRDREAVRKQLHSREPQMYAATGMRLIANARYSPVESALSSDPTIVGCHAVPACCTQRDGAQDWRGQPNSQRIPPSRKHSGKLAVGRSNNQ